MFFDREIKKLGFGLMRLPQKDGAIDVEQVKEMVDMFMDAGCTYFDTAWAYQGSEAAIREALVERYPRDSFQLATKNAAWLMCHSKEEAEAQFETSLRNTGAEYFDNYLLHNLGTPRTQFFDQYEMWDFVRRKKQEGKIRHYGFSFHSSPEELEELLQKHPDVDFVQLQINYADWENISIQSRANYEVARKYGKPIIIMEPLKGGLLADPPETVKKILKEADASLPLASWGIRFAASLEGVLLVLSGMSSVGQMQDNLSYMTDFQSMSGKEIEVVEKARTELESIPIIPCTGCEYCAKVCPENVGISGVFTAANIYYQFGNLPAAKQKAFILTERRGLKMASACLQCGTCEEACPQHIGIREELAKAAQILE